MSKGTEEAGLQAHREALLSRASGRVVEIGAGTGRNLAFYGDGVESLTVTEPDPHMARRLERRIEEHPVRWSSCRRRPRSCPSRTGSSTSPSRRSSSAEWTTRRRALGELRRVLKPGGELLFIEHVRSDEPGLARWQDRLNGLNRVVARCDCNRSTVDAIRAAGFTITELEHERAAEGAAVRPAARGRDGHTELRLTGGPGGLRRRSPRARARRARPRTACRCRRRRSGGGR